MPKVHSLLRWFSVCLILSALCAGALFAQTAGARVEGIVRDASQAVIPGVTVTATNEGTNISFTSLSNDTGLYVFVNIPPGTYSITSELQGFKRYVSKGIVVRIGDTLTINVVLQTGDISNEVVVSAAAPLIDVTSGKIGSVVQERQVLDLPLNGRNPMMLFYLQAGTNPRDSLGGQQAVGSVDGLRTNASNVKVEGVWASDGSFDMSPAAPAVPVPQEAVGEYRVTTSSASADTGRGSGAQVQVVYRSGTNAFHGSVYEFNRNTAYNANNFYTNRANSKRPVFLRNQYGTSLGGPIRKNKTFFFGTWEGQKEIQGSIENITVFTQTARTGVFQYNTTGAANAGAMVDSNGNPLVAFKTIDLLSVDPSRLGLDPSGIVASKLKMIPLPNNYDLGDGFNLGGYRYTSSNPNNGNQFITKIDHILSKSHNLTGSIGGSWFESAGSWVGKTGYRHYQNFTRRRFATLGLISSLTPTLTNELRFGGTRWHTDTQRPDPGTLDHKGNFQLTSLGTGRGLGTNGNPLHVYLPQDTPTVSWNINDNVSWVKGNHTFRFGFEWTHSYSNYRYGGDEYIPTVYPVNSSNPANVPALTGLASADRTRAQQMVNDLTGTIGYINQTYNVNNIKVGYLPFDTRHRLTNQQMYGAFAADTWKLASNLTFNLGVRWDLMPPGYMGNGVYSYPKNGADSVLGMAGPLKITEFGLAPDRGLGIIDWDWNNFGPNVGFTWDPFKDGKMSVSAYYRVAYDRNMIAVTNRLDDTNQGLSTNVQITPFVRFSDPAMYQTVNGKGPYIPLPVGAVFAPIPFERQGRAYALDKGTRTPYTQSWSLRIQRELTKDWFIQGAYVGNISVGGLRAININQVEIRNNGFLTGFLAAQRNLAANGNPNKGESIGVLGQLFAPLGGIPSSQNTTIANGEAATLANFADTTSQDTGIRGGLVTKAGLPVNFFRVNPQVLNANIGDNLSVSTWHGLKIEVGKRFSAGTYFQLNYTLGKGLTDYTGGQSLYADFRDNANRKLDKTFQQYDSTHIIQANAVWELPFGPNKRWLNSLAGWKNAFLGGWQTNGIFSASTGRPFPVTTGRYNLVTYWDSTADFTGKDFNFPAKVVKGNLIYSITPEEKAQYFKNPAAGSAGGTPLRAFRGPLYSNVDASIFKNFKASFLGEQGSVQFRMEGFNIFNHTNFNPPANTNINSGNFGQITAAYSPRILQFALKVTF